MSSFWRNLADLNWKRGASNLTPEAPERRADERYDVSHPVAVGRPDAISIRGTLINLSLGGAAIRVHDWNGPWLAGLEQRDEMWLDGLTPTPVVCWIVVFDDDVLRVHFSPDELSRRRIQRAIDQLTSV